MASSVQYARAPATFGAGKSIDTRKVTANGDTARRQIENAFDLIAEAYITLFGVEEYEKRAITAETFGGKPKVGTTAAKPPKPRKLYDITTKSTVVVAELMVAVSPEDPNATVIYLPNQIPSPVDLKGYQIVDMKKSRGKAHLYPVKIDIPRVPPNLTIFPKRSTENLQAEITADYKLVLRELLGDIARYLRWLMYFDLGEYDRTRGRGYSTDLLLTADHRDALNAFRGIMEPEKASFDGFLEVISEMASTSFWLNAFVNSALAPPTINIGEYFLPWCFVSTRLAFIQAGLRVVMQKYPKDRGYMKAVSTLFRTALLRGNNKHVALGLSYNESKAAFLEMFSFTFMDLKNDLDLLFSRVFYKVIQNYFDQKMMWYELYDMLLYQSTADVDSKVNALLTTLGVFEPGASLKASLGAISTLGGFVIGEPKASLDKKCENEPEMLPFWNIIRTLRILVFASVAILSGEWRETNPPQLIAADASTVLDNLEARAGGSRFNAILDTLVITSRFQIAMQNKGVVRTLYQLFQSHSSRVPKYLPVSQSAAASSSSVAVKEEQSTLPLKTKQRKSSAPSSSSQQEPSPTTVATKGRPSPRVPRLTPATKKKQQFDQDTTPEDFESSLSDDDNPAGTGAPIVDASTVGEPLEHWD